MKNLANVVLYQLTWLACVWGAAHAAWWLGAISLLLFAVVQLCISTSRAADVQLVAVAACVGFGSDSILADSGLLTYADAVPFAHLAPVWIVLLWMNFALTFNHALAFLRGNALLAALFGAIGGPLAYLAAADGFGAVHFNASPALTLALLACIWGFVTPLLTTLAALLANRQGAGNLALAGAR